MITLTSTSQDPKALADVFAANGLTPEAPTTIDGQTSVQGEKKAATGDTPVEGDKHSESDQPAGDKPVDDTTKETPEGEVEKPKDAAVEGEPKPAEKKSKGGFQAKVEKLTAKAEELREALEAERGSKVALQKQLDEVNAKLVEAGIVTKEPEAKKDDGPVRPKRPTRQEHEFDEDKYEAAMDKYDSDLDKYHATVAKQKADEAAAELRKENEQKDAKAAEQERIDAFVRRRQAGEKDFPDLHELLADIPDDHKDLMERSRVAADYLLMESKNPAALMHYLAKDYLENDDAETDRLLALTPFQLVIELNAIEARYTNKGGPTLDPAPVVTPAKQQPKPKQAVPDAPIEPVGGRHTGGGTADLEKELRETRDPVRFRQIRAQLKAAKQARVA